MLIRLAFALILFPGIAAAGTINVPAIATDATTEDPFIKDYLRQLNLDTCKSTGHPKNCTDEQVKAVNPAATIYPATLAGFEAYGRDQIVALKDGAVASSKKRRAAQDLPARFDLATPAQQDACEAALPPLP